MFSHEAFFYFILLKSSKVLTWYNRFKLNGDACECSAWGQTRVHAACSQYANALPTSSPLCCSEHRELSQMFCHDIAAKELSLLWTAPKVWEHVWIPASLRPFQDSHKCILFDLTWIPSWVDFFIPTSSWPLKVGLSHILNMCFDSCCFFFPPKDLCLRQR